MKLKFEEITFVNITGNEKNYEFICDGDKQEITMVLKEEIKNGRED